MVHRLIAKAALRVSSVEIAGETIYVKEPTYAQLAAWREASADSAAAAQTLFRACVLNADGVTPITNEEAHALAHGSVRVLTPLIAAITAQLNPAEAKND